MRQLLIALMAFLCVPALAQQKSKFIDIGAAPSINNALSLGISAPSGYSGLESNYTDSINSNKNTILKVNLFARLSIEKNNNMRYGIGLEYTQYGFKRTVTNPTLGYYKHEELGRVGSIIASQTALDYYTQIRAIEVPLFIESMVGYPKGGNTQFLYAAIAPMIVWDTDMKLITRGFEENGIDKFSLTNFRSPSKRINASATFGYKFIMDINQPVKVSIMPQIKIPVVPTGGDENYLFTQFNLNLGIHFGGKRPTKG